MKSSVLYPVMWGCVAMMWLFIACEEPSKVWTHEGLISHFNSKGRYARFSNSRLMFGDAVDQGIKEKHSVDAHSLLESLI